jgi:hypothetical protein
MKLRPGDLVITPSGKTAAVIGKVNKRRIKVIMLCAVPSPGPRYPGEPTPIGAIYRRKDIRRG